LLNIILNYVQLTTCRRQFLLNYFGDNSSPRSPRCCDNHTADTLEDLPKAVTPQEWFPLIVLETVRTFQERPVGRQRLAQLLGGSQAKDMGQFGYTQHKFYGKLGAFTQPQITALVDALIADRYLRISGGEMPVVTLTEAGLKALDARAALPLAVPEMPELAHPSPSKRPATTEITLSLFQQGLTPDQIAAERNLTQQTIYNHLAQLIGSGEIVLHDVVSPGIESEVLKAIETVGSAGQLTPIKAMLPETITFDQIKCVLAAHPELSREISTPDYPNATQQPALSPAPQPPNTPVPEPAPDTIILDAVAKLGGTLGRTGLAQFLSGSQAVWLETFTQHSCYGRLSHLSQKAILNIIDALITDGKLITTGGNRPKVILPDQHSHTP